MAVYFTVYNFFAFYSDEILLNTCVDNLKREFWGPYLSSLGIHQYYFPVISEYSTAYFRLHRMSPSNR